MSQTDPEIPRSIRRWNDINALGALISLGVSWMCGTALPSVLWGSASLGIYFLLFRPRHLSWGGLGLANLVTLFRLTLLSAASYLLWKDTMALSVVLLVCLLLDGIDGQIARARGEATKFGVHFDMETDAFLVLLLCLALFLSQRFQPWVLLPGALRYVLVVVRWILNPPEPREHRSAFTRCVFVLLASSLLLACWPAIHAAATVLLAVAVLAVCVSFFPDFMFAFQGVGATREEAP